MIHRAYCIQLSFDGDSLPTEFRLFVGGWNETQNGRFLFDDKAAKTVMSSYTEWGVDLMIDLEHQSLDVLPGAPDPTARDARGWCKLELRPDGSLWAVNVKWAPDGAARLADKRQRYVSPAFETDPKTKRILKMINVAITSIPATNKTPALVAASAKRVQKMNFKLLAMNLANAARLSGLDPDLIKKALDAVEAGDAKQAVEILKSLIASAAGAEPEADGDEPGSEGDGAEGVPTPETEAVETPEQVQESADTDDDEDGDDPKKKAMRKALNGALRRLTGKPSFAEAVSEVEVFRASHIALETERVKLAKERATLESAERRKLVTELITLGAEFPATVWGDDQAKTIKSRWLKMPIAELRSHVTEQRTARKPAVRKTGIQPPAPGGSSQIDADVAQLSAMEIQICQDAGCDPKEFVRLKKLRAISSHETLMETRARQQNVTDQQVLALNRGR